MACAQVIKAWKDKWQQLAETATNIYLCFQSPPTAKLDIKALGLLAKCQKLSLSTNMIDRMVNLMEMSKLRVLSLGRNNIKKIKKLKDISGTFMRGLATIR
jgi:dynein light chain 1